VAGVQRVKLARDVEESSVFGFPDRVADRELSDHEFPQGSIDALNTLRREVVEGTKGVNEVTLLQVHAHGVPRVLQVDVLEVNLEFSPLYVDEIGLDVEHLADVLLLQSLREVDHAQLWVIFGLFLRNLGLPSTSVEDVVLIVGTTYNLGRLGEVLQRDRVDVLAEEQIVPQDGLELVDVAVVFDLVREGRSEVDELLDHLLVNSSRRGLVFGRHGIDSLNLFLSLELGDKVGGLQPVGVDLLALLLHLHVLINLGHDIARYLDAAH